MGITRPYLLVKSDYLSSQPPASTNFQVDLIPFPFGRSVPSRLTRRCAGRSGPTPTAVESGGLERRSYPLVIHPGNKHRPASLLQRQIGYTQAIPFDLSREQPSGAANAPPEQHNITRLPERGLHNAFTITRPHPRLVEEIHRLPAGSTDSSLQLRG